MIILGCLGIILIVLGVGCFTYVTMSPIYIVVSIGLIITGLYFLGRNDNNDRKHENSDSGDGPTRTHGDTYFGVYDDDGNFINVTDGSFTQGLDGRWRDDAGHVVDQDDDGEFHM